MIPKMVNLCYSYEYLVFMLFFFQGSLSMNVSNDLSQDHSTNATSVCMRTCIHTCNCMYVYVDVCHFSENLSSKELNC